MATKPEPRYQTVCKACGALPGHFRFIEDAEGRGFRHQDEHTFRVVRYEVDPVMSPEHACTVERVR